MRAWLRGLAAAAAIALGAAGGGCLYTEQAKVLAPVALPLTGEYRVDPALEKKPPQTVAVLPFLNRTEHKEAFDIVRQSFHGHFSRLNFTTAPLFKVDHALAQAGLDTPEKAAAASPQKLREILGVDAFIRGEVTHYDRVFVAVYSQVAVGAEVQMVDGKSGRELWWSREVSRRHGGGVAVTPVGLLLTAATTALNMRQVELLRSSDDLFRDMVKTIPRPTLSQALRAPNITILAHDGFRRTDRYALRAGDRLKVAMEGDPRKNAYFHIGEFRKKIPMKEEGSGQYAGSYKVLPGDGVEEALITGVLSDDQGNASEWVDALGPVTIDAVPPETPAGLKAGGRDRLADVTWSGGPEKDIARYKVYRSSTPLTGYREMGTTELTAFQDPGLTNATSYFYRVSAVDLAGNESRLSEPVKATPVPPGPTPVKGLLTGEVTWFAGASPYLLEGEVTVDPRAVLTVEPGATIRSGGAGLSVLGTLIARGDSQNRISLEGATPGQDWKGIVFNRAQGESAVEFAQISGAEVGIECISSSPRIAHNDISRNKTGIRVRDGFSRPAIQGNSISFNSGSGVEVSAGASPEMEDNEIRGNGKDGIVAREARLTLRKNRVYRNGMAGVRLFSSGCRMQNNSLHDNGEFELYNSPERDIPAEADDNWWGTKEISRLLGRIHGRVDLQRVLDGPQGNPVEFPILKGPLGGPVLKDSFLTPAHSPYVLEKEVVVDQGATLFIRPGVTLRFHPGASILVKRGGIDARGTSDKWITFTSGSASPLPGSYPAAVRFEQESGAASFFRYCVLEFAETALEIAHGAPDIDHCLIARNAQAGIRVAGEAAPKISFSTLAKNSGTGALVSMGSARPKVSRNNFMENAFAIQSHSSIYLDARENWWGETPPGDSLFLGQIGLKPWLEEPEPEAFTGRKP